MKNIWTIMSKEFSRFFTDRRMVVTTLMPAVIIYVLYSFMGTAMESIFAPDADYTPVVYMVNAPDSITQQMAHVNVNISHINTGEIGQIKDRITNKEDNADLLVVFPQGFDALVEVYDALNSLPGTAPNVEVYYNSTVPNSSQTYYNMTGLLDSYESLITNKFDVNRGVESADLATVEDQSATIISMLMPMLLMIFLFSGSMGLALESITGEKERGTLATLLVSPLGRSELAIGKILSLAALSFLSGAATAVATILSLPRMMGSAGGLDTNIYSSADYLLLAFVILTVLLLLIAMLSIVSAFSKTVKEAGQATTPFMILVMVVGVSGMFGSTPADVVYYLIPLYSSVQCMNGIFSLDYSTTNIIVSCLSTLVYACAGGFILTKMFNSEKVMFSR